MIWIESTLSDTLGIQSECPPTQGSAKKKEQVAAVAKRTFAQIYLVYQLHTFQTRRYSSQLPNPSNVRLDGKLLFYKNVSEEL